MASVDRERVARLFAIVVGAASCGKGPGPSPSATTPTTSAAPAANGDPGAPMVDAGVPAQEPKLTCWLVNDPRCATDAGPRIC